MRTPSTAAPPASTGAPRALSVSDLALVLVVLIWGTNYTVVKEALGSFPPLAFMALRFGIASVAMAVVLHTREGWKPLPRATLLKLVGLGLVGNTLYELGSIGPGAWFGVVYSALVPLVLAYVIWNRSVQAMGAALVISGVLVSRRR